MKKEIKFNKYGVHGSDYHYKQINKWNVFSFRASVLARYQKHIELLVKYLPEGSLKKRVRILDIGCGDGALLYLLKKHYNFELYGADLSPEALKVARLKIPAGQFVEKGAYDTGFKNNYFDAVISSDVIEHVQYPDKMLCEAKRVLKNNSLIVIGTPIRYTEKPLDKMHYREYYPEEFRRMVGKFFHNVKLVESQNLFWELMCLRIFSIGGKKIRVFLYLINMLSYFGKNIFLRGRSNNQEMFAYMFCIGIKK